jgi:iron(III) transport system ATP-binding protein
VLAGNGTMVPPERRNIGLVFQDFALFPHLTALENVAYGLYALNRAEALRVARLALDRVALGHVVNSFPAALSGGEQQRVALARALVPRPQVVLLDEPFSGLDQRLKESVRDDALSLLRETRATAILVTHDPDEALAFADHIHVMQDGRIAQSGTPAEVLNRPRNMAVARFFRNYNCFQAIVDKGIAATALGAVPAPNNADGTLVDVLVAPNAITIGPPGQGVAAFITENRDMGFSRRIVARLQGHDAGLLIHHPFQGLGEVGLVLTGSDTHIFPANAD